MGEKCNKCGKETILNAKGECFDCAEVQGTKYFAKKKVMSRKAAKIVWIATGLLNIWFTHGLLSEAYNVNFVPSLLYVIGAVCIMGAFIRLKDYYAVAKVPFIAMILKVVLFVDIPRTISDLSLWRGGIIGDAAYKWLNKTNELIVPIIVYIVLSVIFEVAFKLSKLGGSKKHFMVLNEVLDKEKMLAKLEDIPNYTSSFTEEYKTTEYEKELKTAIQLVRDFRAEETVKEKVINALKNRDSELWLQNDAKYVYCNVVQELLNHTFRKDDMGNWIDEIAYDTSSWELPMEIPTIIPVGGRHKYVTRNLFNLYERVNQHVNTKWEQFKGRNNSLNPTKWFKDFLLETIGISTGEQGEWKVAKELEPYEGQMIILPNIRLEVEGESIESDFVVISPYGIHILEVKNLGTGGGFKLLIEKDGRWQKIYGNTRHDMDNPVHQNERHILYMEKFINKELGRSLDDYFNIHGMVVIANDKVDIINESTSHIRRYDSIVGTIRSYDKVLKEAEMKQIAEILTKASLPTKSHPMENYFELYFKTKILTKEYQEWKEHAKKLISYAETYKYEVFEHDKN